jgi:putative ABC transport system permease protein
VGIRKVLGSEKKQLIRQFLSEAMLYSFISALTAIVLVIVFLKPFNVVAGKALGFSLIFTNGNWLYILMLSVITGLLAGSYPAFYLTSFQPVAVLKRHETFYIQTRKPIYQEWSRSFSIHSFHSAHHLHTHSI